MAELKPALLSTTDVCQVIGRSRSSLARLRKLDPSFPQPIKTGNTRQAWVYWPAEEIYAWVKTQADSRTHNKEAA